MQRNLVIFDLDETLVHATTQALAHPPDFRFGEYFVYVRPNLVKLLDTIAPRFDLAVWSSASRPYVEAVTAKLFEDRVPLKFVWSVERCVQRADAKSNGYVYVKDLRKVQSQGYRVEDILMVDDSPEKIARQPRNHIRIAPFAGELDDTSLLDLPDVLFRAADSGHS